MSINAIIYNNGSVAANGVNPSAFSVSGDYHQSADAELSLTIAGMKPAFQVTGEAKLGGILAIANAEGFKPTPGESYTVLTASRITGTFTNPRGEVVASDSSRFAIHYSTSAVSLIVK